MKKLLFITNGHGEDLVAAEIIKRLKGRAELTVLPVVGEGKAFESLNIKILGPRKKFPGGGFSLRNLLFLARDIYAGLIGNTLEQLGLLKELQGQFDLTVAIGDIVPIIGALRAKAPFIFVGVNKSSYYKWFGYNYTPWEKILLQRYALKVFVRDKTTEESLKSRGIKIRSAEYVGNPLMDCFEKIRIPHSAFRNIKTIGFLPGTREDARLNMEDFEKVAEEIIRTKDPDTKLEFITATDLKDIPEYMENRPFAAVLAKSDLIIGLSGTGNEQAAGSGIPVISFYGRGSQYNKRFAQAQKQLLGEALSLVRDSDPLPVAGEVWQLLRNPEKMEEMRKVGKERMGKGGAAERIADFILDLR
jgi:hypothetical protein